MYQEMFITQTTLLIAAVATASRIKKDEKVLYPDFARGSPQFATTGPPIYGGLITFLKGDKKMNYLEIAKDLAKDTEALNEMRQNDKATYSKIKASLEEEVKKGTGISYEAERILSPGDLKKALSQTRIHIDEEGLDEKIYPEVELSKMMNPEKFLAEMNYERSIDEINASINKYAAAYTRAGGKIDVATLRDRALLNRNKHIDAHYETLDELYERNVSRKDAIEDARSENYQEPVSQKRELLDDTMEPDYEPTL